MGIDAGVNKLGREFVKKYKDNACASYLNWRQAAEFGYVDCSVSVSDKPPKPFPEGHIILSSAPEDRFPYRANCRVAYDTGEITFYDCVLP